MIHNRATKQLIHFAGHYLSLARRIRCDDLDTSITDLDKRFTPRNNVYLCLAHLASAAFRIVNLCESYKLDEFNYRKCGINDIKSDLDKYIAYLLRDHVGHTEHEQYNVHIKVRKPIIKALTPRKIENHLHNNFKMIKKKIIEIELKEPIA